jgi:hypothetical protein
LVGIGKARLRPFAEILFQEYDNPKTMTEVPIRQSESAKPHPQPGLAQDGPYFECAPDAQPCAGIQALLNLRTKLDHRRRERDPHRSSFRPIAVAGQFQGASVHMQQLHRM